MITQRIKTEILPKALIIMALLPAVITPLIYVYMRYSWGAPFPSGPYEPVWIALMTLVLLRQITGMAFTLSLALLALAYYGKKPDIEIHKRRFIVTGRAFAGVITANWLLVMGVTAKAFFIPARVSTVLADGTVNRTVSRTFTLSPGTDMLNWLALIVAVLLIIDLIDETLSLRAESSLTV